MLPEPRLPFLRLPPVVHGGPDLEELKRLGLDPEKVLDFSTNINPYGPSRTVRAALAAVPLEQYPDRKALTLRAALVEALGFAPAHILPGNGASELIGLVALAFVRPGDPVLVLGPTYGEYGRAALLMGGRVEAVNAREENGFAVDPELVSRRLGEFRPRLVFLCNPNNPTGAVIATETLAAWAAGHPGTLFVVDEAYWPFTTGLPSALTLGAGNLLVLRSLTKDLGLAGLRLGYAVGPRELIALLARVQPPWSVNALAQAAGMAALADPDHWQRTRALLFQAKDSLTAGLRDLGLAPLPSAAHFFLVRVGVGAAVRRALLRRGILVRDGASFGLPAYLRLAPRRPEDNERLLAALREVL